jgi:serine/threonine-protein kinase
MVKGKFAYMSPEQVSGLPVDRRSDIFGMGVLLYLLTTGRHPFKGETVAETVRNVCLDRPPVSPSEIIPGYPPALEAIVVKALAKSANQRWATAHELLAALEHAMPEALEASFEAEVSRYMDQLLGARAAERRTQLRLAQQLADRLRADASQNIGEPTSLGSLRTVSVGDGTGSSIRMNKDGAIQVPGAIAEVTSSGDGGKRSSWFGIAIGVGGLVLALGLVAFDRFAFQSRNAANAAPLILPPIPTESAHPVPLPVPAEAPTATGEVRLAPETLHAPLPSASFAAPAPPPPVRETVRTSKKPQNAGRSAPSAASLAAAASPAPAAPAASLPEAPRGEKPDTAKVNAWDTDSFGGRR